MEEEQKNKTDKENKMPLLQQASEYLERHQIYDLFSSLMSSLVINRPSEPISFIIQTLTSSDPCRICVVSNDSTLSRKCAAFFQQRFESKIYEIPQSSIDTVIKNIQTEKNFILVNYPQTRSQALHLLESRVIPDRVFLVTKYKIEHFHEDIGDNDLVALKQVFKHNIRIICCDAKGGYNEQLEQMLLSSFYEQRINPNNLLTPKFPARVLILAPSVNSCATKLCSYLEKRLRLYYLNAAHVLQRHLELHTELGITAENDLQTKQENQAVYVDNEILIEMMANDVANDKHILKDGYVLDQFPRNTEQANCMLKFGLKPNRIIVLNGVVNENENVEYKNDNVEPARTSVADKNEADTDVSNQYLQEIVKMLCDKQQNTCAVQTFDVQDCEWETLLELAYDFVVQPLPRQ